MVKLRKKFITIFLILGVLLTTFTGLFVNTSQVSAASFVKDMELEININSSAKVYTVNELVTQGSLSTAPNEVGTFEKYDATNAVLQYDGLTTVTNESGSLKIVGNFVGQSIFKVKIRWATTGLVEYTVQATIISQLPSTAPASLNVGATPAESNLRLYRGIKTRVDFIAQVPTVQTSGFVSLKNKVANDLNIKSFGAGGSGIYINIISSDNDKILVTEVESGLNDKTKIHFNMQILDPTLTIAKVTVEFKSLSSTLAVEMSFTMSDGSAGGASLKSVDQITQKISGRNPINIKFKDLFDGLALNDSIVLTPNSAIEFNSQVINVEEVLNSNNQADSVNITPNVVGYTSIKLQLIHVGSAGNVSLSASIPIEIKGIYSFVSLEEYAGKELKYSTKDSVFKSAGYDGYLFAGVEEVSDENIANALVEDGKLIISTKSEGTAKIVVRLYNPVTGNGESDYVLATVPITVNKNIFFNSLTTAGIIAFAVLMGIILLLILYFVLSIVFKARKKKRERLEFEKQTAKKLSEKKEIQDKIRQSQARAAMGSSMMMGNMMGQQMMSNAMSAGLALGAGQSMANPNALQLNGGGGAPPKQKSTMLLNTATEQMSSSSASDNQSKAKGASDADNFLKEIAEKAKKNAEKAAAEKKAKEEEARKSKEEANKKAKAEAERKAKIEAARKAAAAKAAQEAKEKAEKEKEQSVTSKQIFDESIQVVPPEQVIQPTAETVVLQETVEEPVYLTDDQAFEAALLALASLSPEEKAGKEKLFAEKRVQAMTLQNEICELMTDGSKAKKLIYSKDFANKRLDEEIDKINQKLPTCQSEEEITMYQNMITQNQETAKELKTQIADLNNDYMAGETSKQNKVISINDVLAEKELGPYKKQLEKNRDNLQIELDKDYEKYLENYAQEANANQALEEVERMKAEMRRKSEEEKQKELNAIVNSRVSQINEIIESIGQAKELNDIENANIRLATISQAMGEEESADNRIINAFDNAANILNERYNEILQMQQANEERDKNIKAATDEVVAINSKLVEGLKLQMEGEKEKFKRTYDNERAMAKINGIVASMQTVSDPSKITLMQTDVAELNKAIAERNSEISDIDNQVASEVGGMEDEQNKMFNLIGQYALNDLQNQLQTQNDQTQAMLENDYNQFVQNYKQSVELREQQEETARIQKQMLEQALQNAINAKLSEISLIAKDVASSPNLEVLKNNTDKISMFENSLKDEEKADSVKAAVKNTKAIAQNRENAIKDVIRKAEQLEKEIAAVRAEIIKLKEQIPTVKTLEEAETLFNKFEKIEDGLKDSLKVERVLTPIAKCKEAVLRMQELIKSKMQKPKKKKMIKKTIISKKKKKTTKKKVAGKSASGKTGTKKSSSSSKSSKGKTSSSKKSSGKSKTSVKSKKK